MLARVYLQMLDGESVLSAIGDPSDVPPTELDWYRIRSRALYLEGDYSPLSLTHGASPSSRRPNLMLYYHLKYSPLWGELMRP